MLDTVTFRMDIRLDQKILIKNGWFWNKNKNEMSEYSKIYNKSVKDVDLHFTYLHRAGWVPSILRIDTHSLPKLIHGSNVWYFSSSDIDAFHSLLQTHLQRVGIGVKIDMKELKIEKADFAIILLLNNQHTVRRILKAIKQQVIWSGRILREIFPNGVYKYFKSDVPQKRKKYQAGSKFYDKKRELKHLSVFNGKGALRWEIHGPNREWMKRRFGKLPTLEEFYSEEGWVKRLFETYLRYFDVYPDCRLVSESKAEKIVRKGRPRKGWNYDLQKLDAMIQLGQDSFDYKFGLKTSEQASDFRDKVLRDRYGLLQFFLNGKTEITYNLHSMIMDELDKAWRQKSVFTVPVRVKAVGPRYILPYDDVVRPQLKAAELYHNERGFSMYNHALEKRALFHLQLGCNRVL